MQMRFSLRNLNYFVTLTSDFIPEVLEHPSLRNPIAVTPGATDGAPSSYYLSIWITQRLGTSFPYATLIVNLTGSFALGLLTSLVLERVFPISPEVRLLIATGFLGSYTTFSTYELDTISLVQESSFNKAIIYWFGSAAIGAISLYLGIMAARFMR